MSAPNPEFGGGVTLVTGTNNFLIDCGAFDYSVSKFIVPALKALKMDIRDIDYLLFTHCNQECIGGVHKLKQLSPDTKVMTYGYQSDRLKNPTYYFMEKWADALDFSPAFREIKGVLADGAVDVDNRVFTELKPILAQGHDADCVCWFHPATETLICGDAVQGDGTDVTGIAFFTSLQMYRNTLSDLIETSPENMICSKAFRGCPEIIKGKDECMKVLEVSYEMTNEYAAFVDKYAKLVRKKKENLDVYDVAMAYFENKPQPSKYGYAMKTLGEYLKGKR
jgi:glyoxylase-like metal-dependent hydrolase (beta-lactamase superfamily II)